MQAPEKLVEAGKRHYGRFAARPVTVNPLDAFPAPVRALKRLRLKEWIGFTLIHPEAACSLIMQDAGYLASSQLYCHAAGTTHRRAANTRGGGATLPAALADADCVFAARGYRIAYRFSAGQLCHRVNIDITAAASAPAIAGELELLAAKASPALSVSSRLDGGAMYTHKVIYPARGELRVGDHEITFDPQRDFAILDEHRSLLPYRTKWLWGTFAQRDGESIVGANFARRPMVDGEPEESCLWTPRAAEPLRDITFTPGSDDVMSPWSIRSRDERLAVTFIPEGREAVRHQLGILAIDYYQLFGTYRGEIRGADRVYEVAARGVCESMRARL